MKDFYLATFIIILFLGCLDGIWVGLNRVNRAYQEGHKEALSIPNDPTEYERGRMDGMSEEFNQTIDQMIEQAEKCVPSKRTKPYEKYYGSITFSNGKNLVRISCEDLKKGYEVNLDGIWRGVYSNRMTVSSTTCIMQFGNLEKCIFQVAL